MLSAHQRCAPEGIDELPRRALVVLEHNDEPARLRLGNVLPVVVLLLHERDADPGV